MNVLVEIDGREAIPVRAIPLLTTWEKLSPDLIAEILGECDESDHYEKFKGLRAHRIEGKTTLPIQPGHWRNFVARDLRALSHRIKSNQITHEDGHSRWRRESIELLPEGAFVWRDEFEARFWATFDKGGYLVRNDVDGRLQEQVQPSEVDLSYDPFIPSDAAARLVMAGFVDLQSSSEPSANEPKTAHGHEPAVSVSQETQAARRARRAQMCIDEGLTLPDTDYAALPRGIGKLAKREGISTSAFSEDLKKHIASQRSK